MASNLIGTVLGDRYRIVRVLGEGGMGTVYLARHLQLGAQVAIKMLGEEFGDQPGFRRRFHDEARATAGVPHEHIVRVGEVDTTPDGRIYYVMEYLEGEDLAQTLEREGRLGWQRVRSIAAQLCGALAAAHDQKIVHRDLKPGNCFRTVSGESEDFIKILDFGIAKLLADEGQRARVTDSQGLERVDSRRWRHTVTGEILGTMAYMSPEHFFGDPVDHRTDIYALGVILYELLTGRLPLATENVGRFAYDLKFLVPDPPSVAAPDAGIPADIDYVVMRALEKQAHDRFGSMREMAAALAEAREDRPISPLALPATAMAVTVDSAVGDEVDDGPMLGVAAGRARGGGGRVWLGAALGVLSVLGVVLAALVWRDRAPAIEAPVSVAPVVEAPVVEAPVVEAPVIEAPVAEAPGVEMLADEEPLAEVAATAPEPTSEVAATPTSTTPARKKAAAKKSALPDCGRVASAEWRKILDPARRYVPLCRASVPANVTVLVNVGLAGGKAVAGPLPGQSGKLQKASQCIARLLAHHAVVPAKWSSCRASASPHAF